MTTSRTGTGRWKQLRKVALQQAQDAGLTRCPCDGDCKHHTRRVCNMWLEYERGKQPNSAEPDHIRPHARGGQDTIENVRIICRRCNQARGKKHLTSAGPTEPATTTTLVAW